MTVDVLDLRPLQEGHAARGIGRYVTTLVSAVPFNRFVVWNGLPVPSNAVGSDLIRVPGAPHPGRLGWLRDSRPVARRGTAVHVPVADVRLALPRPDVVTSHDAIPWRFPRDYPSGRIGSVRRRGDERLARRASVVIVPSEASAEDATRFLGVRERNVHVVPHAAGPPWPEPQRNAGRFSPEQLRGGRRYVIAAGGFRDRDPRKRLGDLLLALAALPDEVALVVTGADGPEAAAFRDEARTRGVAGRVELTGQVADEDLVSLYAGAAAFAFPSAWEGFGLPLLEAMSVGLPCVVSSGGALPEVAGDGARVVPVGAPRAMADALAEVLADAARARDASCKATARAAQFTLARFAAGHLKAYGSV